MVKNIDVRVTAKDSLYPATLDKLRRIHRTLEEFREHQVPHPSDDCWSKPVTDCILHRLDGTSLSYSSDRSKRCDECAMTFSGEQHSGSVGSESFRRAVEEAGAELGTLENSLSSES